MEKETRIIEINGVKLEEELRDMKSNREYFLNMFGKYFDEHLNK